PRCTRPGDVRPLRLLRVEEAQEGCVLRKEGFDLGDAGAGPVLDPGFAEVVLDVMKAAFAHPRKYRHEARTTPLAHRLLRGVPESHTPGPWPPSRSAIPAPPG